MKKFFILITTLLCNFSTIALYADYSEEIGNRGLYLGLSTGAQFDNSCSNFVRSDPGFYVGGALGYKFCNFIRVEGECSFQKFDLTYPIAYIHYDFVDGVHRSVHHHKGHGNIISTMANAYYDFDWINYSIKPYLGLGIGYAHTKLCYNRSSSSANTLAWQAIAGVSYSICKNIDISLEYRCFQENCLRNNKVGLSLRHYF